MPHEAAEIFARQFPAVYLPTQAVPSDERSSNDDRFDL